MAEFGQGLWAGILGCLAVADRVAVDMLGAGKFDSVRTLDLAGRLGDKGEGRVGHSWDIGEAGVAAHKSIVVEAVMGGKGY